MPRIDSFLKLGLAQGCSDVHLAVGVPPMLRMNGDLMPIKFRELSDTELESYVMEILSDSQKEHFYSGKDLDFSYVGEEGSRFRVNLFRKVSGIGAVFRFIPNEVPTLEGLDMPETVRDFCDYHQGMVLCTGPTGCGKSSTLAALVDLINEERKEHILTIEDPIEYLHTSKRCLVNQRSAGHHTESFARALRAALREEKHRDELAGYLCIGLSLMDARDAMGEIRELVITSARRPPLGAVIPRST